jgi:hypothetical protein
MKKFALIFILSFFFISCEKDYLIPNKEVPDWLKTIISQEEQIIKDSPQLMNSFGAWLRYNWQNDYYFEYHNVLSSSLPRVISSKGDTLNFYATDANTDYFKKKCCKEYVWKAPKYEDLPGM